MVCIGPIDLRVPLSSTFAHLTFLQLHGDAYAKHTSRDLQRSCQQNFSFVLSLHIFEFHKHVREEHKFRIYIFEKSIGAWKTIVLYHIFANVANCCQDNFFASYTNKFSKQCVREPFIYVLAEFVR